jgi:hypothetical protein
LTTFVLLDSLTVDGLYSTPERSMFTPEKLAEQKLTLGDLPPSVYDHETQTRKFPEGEKTPLMTPSTNFDGESA